MLHKSLRQMCVQQSAPLHRNERSQKIEAPVRDTIPDQGPPVSERDWGQEALNPDLKSDQVGALSCLVWD